MYLGLLLDENLSPQVAKVLRADGVDCIHVQDRAFLGRSDPEVFALGYTESRVIVTCNVGDFVALAKVATLHAGLILISDQGGSLPPPRAIALLRQLLPKLSNTDLTNRVVWVEADWSHRIGDLPAP